VDPNSNYHPNNSENYLGGEHNGGVFNPQNQNPYIYCYHNPIIYIDPNGRQTLAYTILEWIGADLAVPEPSDAVPYKWVGYAVASAVALVAIAVHDDPKDSHYQQASSNSSNNQKSKSPSSKQKNKEKESSKKHNLGKKNLDKGKNERHGDNGRAKNKAEQQIQDLEQKAKNSNSKKEKKRINNKIRNIRSDAAKKQRGEEHSRSNKR
jgi:hypothetical protein